MVFRNGATTVSEAIYSLTLFIVAVVYCAIETRRRKDAEREARRYFVALLQIRNHDDGSTAHRIASEAIAGETR